MALVLNDFEQRARMAIQHFWQARDAALAAQMGRNAADQGSRGSVTAGKHMDGFINLIRNVVAENGLMLSDVFLTPSESVLPGYFRATKSWDVVVVRDGKLVAAIELKSQVGPSFGNNFNNRCEEALGSATDLLTAFREGKFGPNAPFMGYLMALEDCTAVHTPVHTAEPHFMVFEDFKQASYARRYELLCERLVKEHLYNKAALILSPQQAGMAEGEYSEPNPARGLRSLMLALAGHIATVAASL